MCLKRFLLGDKPFCEKRFSVCSGIWCTVVIKIVPIHCIRTGDLVQLSLFLIFHADGGHIPHVRHSLTTTYILMPFALLLTYFASNFLSIFPIQKNLDLVLDIVEDLLILLVFLRDLQYKLTFYNVCHLKRRMAA